MASGARERFWREFERAPAHTLPPPLRAPDAATAETCVLFVNRYPSAAHSFGGSLPLGALRQTPCVGLVSSAVWRTEGLVLRRAAPCFREVDRRLRLLAVQGEEGQERGD